MTGKPEIWQTLKAVLEVLWKGDEDGGVDGGLGTAQMMIEAAGITVPTGDLASGVYDVFGEFYMMPEHIVADPENVIESSAGAGDKLDEEEDKSGSEELNEEEILRRREEKGKAVVKPKDLIKVRARLSDRGGQDLVVNIGKDDSVRLLTRKIFEDGLVSSAPNFPAS